MQKVIRQELTQDQIFHIKKTIRSLSSVRGIGTSLLTLYIAPSNAQLYQMRQKLVEEEGAAVNIKKAANRKSV